MNDKSLKLGPLNVTSRSAALRYIIQNNKRLSGFWLFNSIFGMFCLFIGFLSIFGHGQSSELLSLAFAFCIIVIPAFVLIRRACTDLATGYIEFVDTNIHLHHVGRLHSVAISEIERVRRLSKNTIGCFIRMRPNSRASSIVFYRTSDEEIEVIFQAFKKFTPTALLEPWPVDISIRKTVAKGLLIWLLITVFWIIFGVQTMHPLTINEAISGVLIVLANKQSLFLYCAVITVTVVGPLVALIWRRRSHEGQ